MTDKHNLYAHLAAWTEFGSKVAEAHIDDATLYQLTTAGALVAAEAKTLRHLSLCPLCMKSWADWRRARSAAEETDTGQAEVELAFGFLQAAATPELTDSISTLSPCGSYRLDILPQEGDSGHGLVVFEVMSAPSRLEDATVTIRDREARLLLQGTLSAGRLARPIADPGQFDLSTWTVTIEKNRSDQNS